MAIKDFTFTLWILLFLHIGPIAYLMELANFFAILRESLFWLGGAIKLCSMIICNTVVACQNNGYFALFLIIIT